MTLTSSPVTVSVDAPGSVPGLQLLVVMMPSISTCGHGVERHHEDHAVERAQQRVGQQRVVERGPRGPTRPAWNASWKPLGRSSLCVTSTLDERLGQRAAAPAPATIGPISSVRWMPSSS